MFFASKGLCTALLAISTLIMSSPVYAEENLHFGHFAIKVHLPVEGDCSKREEIQDKGGNKKSAIVHAGNCQNYDPFRAFAYQYAGYGVKKPENPYKYGLCSVKVFSQPDCKGEPLIDHVDGNNWNRFGKCVTEPFKGKAGRSVKVEKCNKKWPKNITKAPKPTGR